jgi:hypothetical protein
MKRLLYSASIALLASLAIGTLLFRHVRQTHAESAQATREAAAADAAEITRQANRYWERENRLTQLENDEMQLKNDRLSQDIARLEGKPFGRARIEEDLKIIQNDKAAIQIMDPGAPALNPYEVEARIAEHNRKYPLDRLAQISDTIRQMEKFDSDVRAIRDRENEQLRKLHTKQ